MDKYIGFKMIEAKPMTGEDAAKLLNRFIDASNADAEGNGYLVKYEDGYTSWSPKAQFEKAYTKAEARRTIGAGLEIQPLDSSVFLIKLKEDPLPEEIEALKKAWRTAMCYEGAPKVTALLAPNTINIKSLDGATFDFTMALQLLKLGHKITRTYWMDGDNAVYWLELVDNDIKKGRMCDGNLSYWDDAESAALLAEDYKLMKS